MLGYYTFMASARMWTKWSKNEQRDDSQKTLKPTKLSVTVAGLVIFSVGVGMILKYFGIIQLEKDFNTLTIMIGSWLIVYNEKLFNIKIFWNIFKCLNYRATMERGRSAAQH